MNWQPIDTAPTDGYVFLYGDDQFMVAYFSDGHWHADDGYRVHEATHWMPLVKPGVGVEITSELPLKELRELETAFAALKSAFQAKVVSP